MTETTNLVRYEQEGSIATITLDRPPVNALSAAVYEGLLQRVAQLNNDMDAKVAILTGAGRRAFTAGADVRELAALDAETRRARHGMVEAVWAAVANATLPIICAINGPAPGGGTVLASLCDYRIAADDVHFSFPEIDRGSAAGGGAFMRRLGVPSGTVRELLYTGRRIDPAEAVALRIIDRIVPYDQLMPACLEMAERIASKDRAALVLMKQAILKTEEQTSWLAAYRATHDLSARMITETDAKARIEGFLSGSERPER